MRYTTQCLETCTRMNYQSVNTDKQLEKIMSKHRINCQVKSRDYPNKIMEKISSWNQG